MALSWVVRRVSGSKLRLPICSLGPSKAFSTDTECESDIYSESDTESEFGIPVTVEEVGTYREFTYKKIARSRNRFLGLQRMYGDEKIYIDVGRPFGLRERPCFPVRVRIFYGQDRDNTAEFEIKLSPQHMRVQSLYMTTLSDSQHMQFFEKSFQKRGIKPSLLDIVKGSIGEQLGGLVRATERERH